MKTLFIILGQENPLQKKWISKLPKTDSIHRIEANNQEEFFNFFKSSSKVKNNDAIFICGDNSFVNKANLECYVAETKLDFLNPITLGRVGIHDNGLCFNSVSGALITFDVATKAQKYLKKTNFSPPYVDVSLSFAALMQLIELSVRLNEPSLFLAHGLSHPENNGANISKLICVGGCNPTDFDILNKTL